MKRLLMEIGFEWATNNVRVRLSAIVGFTGTALTKILRLLGCRRGTVMAHQKGGYLKLAVISTLFTLRRDFHHADRTSVFGS
jgi:hypothetical protein